MKRKKEEDEVKHIMEPMKSLHDSTRSNVSEILPAAPGIKRRRFASEGNLKGLCEQVYSRRASTPIVAIDQRKVNRPKGLDNSPQPSSSFDFRFIASTREAQNILATLTAADEYLDVILVSHPDGLAQDNLVHRLMISADGKYRIDTGKLFESTVPLTLVLDVRALTAEELPRFNDLLDPDTPCLYDKLTKKKRRLGSHVNILVLADPRQLAGAGFDDDAPGADFWRRVNRRDNTWHPDGRATNPEARAVGKIVLPREHLSTEVATEQPDSITIDCHLSNNWRHLLFGGPGVDDKGRINHIPGQLEQIQPGQTVILKGADRDDLAFEQSMRLLLARKQYDSNGQARSLPDDVQFFLANIGENELGHMFNDMDLKIDHSPQDPIIINHTNLSEWLNPTGIDEQGCAAANTALSERIRAGATVAITSPLSEAMWFSLLGCLQRIHRQAAVLPALFVAHPKGQPEQLDLNAVTSSKEPEKAPRDICQNRQLKTVTYRHEEQAREWLESRKPMSLAIQVNEKTTRTQLFDNIHVNSEKMARFGRNQTDLQKALKEGQPVVFCGLETNPALQWALEPFCCDQPIMLVNGSLQQYPDANITLLWPESEQSPSSLWTRALDSAQKCPELNILKSAATRHRMKRDDLPEQALDALYKAFSTIPNGLTPAPGRLPALTGGLLDNLIHAARQAQQIDTADTLHPRHWRKAINSVLTHGTRQNPAVRDFMKVACEQLLPDPDQPPWADPDRLAGVLSGCDRLNRAFVKEHFWQLVRAFHPAAFEQLQLGFDCPFPFYWRERMMDVVCALVAAHAPESIHDSVAFLLQVDPALISLHQKLAVRPSGRIKRIEDALASGWCIRSLDNQHQSRLISELATACFAIAGDASVDDTNRKDRIRKKITGALTWKGTGTAPLEALTDDLYRGNVGQADRENRRLHRLKVRLAESPVIFLQGETGTGKSYFAANMAKEAGPAFIVSIGPSASEQNLMKRWVWKDLEDDDRRMEQQDQILLDWAKAKASSGDDYVTLVLDEANLANKGLLACLKGLWQEPPCIYVNGHPVSVSPKHRVVLTGNPDSYAGRQLDPALQAAMQCIHYPPLDCAFLQDHVVEPALRRHLLPHMAKAQAETLVRQATKSVLALWQYYPELLPDHEFTPRDLTDICAWIGWYLNQSNVVPWEVTVEHIHALVLQGFGDVLNSELTEDKKDALSALKIWSGVHYPPDNELIERVQRNTLQLTCNYFRFETERNKPEFDTSAAAVTELVQALGQDLSRCQQACQRKENHGGRQATLIEGPAGRGKDVTLQLLIDSFTAQTKLNNQPMPHVHILNACDCSWDTVRSTLREASGKGGILLISELNKFEPQNLEGELNDILAGNAHPGFHLFATINPPQYSGRKPLSPALKGRFRHIPVREYNRDELAAIAGKVLPENPEGKNTAARLTGMHCRLRRYLHQKNLPLQPTSLDLQKLASVVAEQEEDSGECLQALFKRHYRLYLMKAQCTLDELPEATAGKVALNPCDMALCRWLNETVTTVKRPWIIRRGDSSSIDSDRYEMTVHTQLDGSAARQVMVKMMAGVQWRESGLPLDPPDADNKLTQALYRRWQHHWFDQCFAHAGVKSEVVFPLNDAQNQMLTMGINKPYLVEADRLMAEQNLSDVKLWPACWEQIKLILNNPVKHYQHREPVQQPSEEPAIGLDAQASLPSTSRKVLDHETNYENRAQLPVSRYRKIFDSNHHPKRYRLRVFDLQVDPSGSIYLVTTECGQYGLESIVPGNLPDQGEIPLSAGAGQFLAVATVTCFNDKWLYLPSLTASETITAMRTEPATSYQVIKDRCTGLHMVYFPEAKSGELITVHYVVETGGQMENAHQKTRGYHHSSGISQPGRPDATCSKQMKTEINKLLKPVTMKCLPQDQQAELRAIQDADNPKKRVEAIRRYCLEFQGKSKPEIGENLFAFLLKQRQGTCRHRTPLFVALCRYYGIPARIIGNHIHSFAEYSLDNGHTWKAENLGGAPSQLMKETPVFQSTRQGIGSAAFSQRMAGFLKKGSPEQRATLSRALGVTEEELIQSIQSGCALPATKDSLRLPVNTDIVNKLWEEKCPSSFFIGAELLKSREHLNFREELLMGSWISKKSQLANTLAGIFSLDRDTSHLIEALKQLHTKLVKNGSVDSANWQYSIVSTLEPCTIDGLDNPQVINLAQIAFESGWLNPMKDTFNFAMTKHNMLKRLETVEAIKPLVKASLQKWYSFWLTNEKNSDVITDRLNKVIPSIVSHGHGGKSVYLESALKTRSLLLSWTDEPEGVPDIERMLTRNPPFPVLGSGKTGHRPVIMMESPRWFETTLAEKIQALYERHLHNHPADMQLSQRQENKVSVDKDEGDRLSKVIKTYAKATTSAFEHYLYQITNLHGGRLAVCWIDASINHSGIQQRSQYGSHVPRSQAEVTIMMSEINEQNTDTIDYSYLRKAHNAHNAVVLKAKELTIIAQEFLDTVNMDSLFKEVISKL